MEGYVESNKSIVIMVNNIYIYMVVAVWSSLLGERERKTRIGEQSLQRTTVVDGAINKNLQIERLHFAAERRRINLFITTCVIKR